MLRKESRPTEQVPNNVIQALIQEEKQVCQDDCHYFIKTYVRIEDRDEAGNQIDDPDSEADGIVIPFAMWPKQAWALSQLLKNRLSIILKARQLGLTWLVLAYAVWRLLHNPGYQVVALSKKETPDAKELIRRVKFILRYLPSWMIREKKKAPRGWTGPTWESTALSITINHAEGEPSVFLSMASSPDAGRSFTANLILLDEWAFQQWAEEIWTSAYPIINRPTGGQVIGLSTSKRNTLFEEIWEKATKGENNFARIFLAWDTDPRRTPEWYEQTKRDLPNSYMTEYPSTPEEAFSAGEGTAFPEFSRDIHVCRPFQIPWWWKRWRANDPGYTDPFAWYCLAASEDGKVYVYREYTREPNTPRVPYSEQAKELTKRCTYIDADGNTEPEKFGFTVCGRDAFNRHPETGKSIADYYSNGGVKGCIEPPRDTRTDRVLRAAVLHEYLKPYLDENTGRTTAKLQIFDTCTKLIETLPKLTTDENDPDKVAECNIDHWFDAVGYGLVTWHSRQSKPPEPEKSTIQLDKERLAKQLKRHKKRYA